MLKFFQKVWDSAKHSVERLSYSWDDGLSVWQKRIEEMPWQEAQKIMSGFSPRAYEPWRQHDDELWKLLWQRLFCIEQPVFQPDLMSYGGMLLRVEDGSSNDYIKEEAELHLRPFEKPRFVVEDCGRLRGFALSPQLVIAGVTAVSAFPAAVEKKAQEFGYSLLTEADAVCLEKHWDALCRMMAMAGVPSLQGINAFQLRSADSYPDYPVWHHMRRCFSFIEDDDCSVLLAKL